MINKRQIILDTETTGLYANNGDRLIEFAGLEMIDRRLTGRFLHLYVNPERDIPDEAIAIHGITSAQVADKPVFAQIGSQIIDFIKDAELIIHNAPFDVGFLNMEFTRMKLPWLNNVVAKITDTLTMAKELYPGQKNNLDVLCTRLNVDRSKRTLHGALIDCELLSEVYLAMTRSQFSLDMNESSSELSPADQQLAFQRPASIKVLQPTAEEQQLHLAYLDKLDKACGGTCLYHQLEE